MLCADKTGTLTKNKLELQDPVLFAMVTGDHLAIAKQVAGQLNLGQNIKVATDVF